MTDSLAARRGEAGAGVLPRLAFAPPGWMAGAHAQSMLGGLRPRQLVARHARGLIARSRPQVLTTAGGVRLEVVVSRHEPAARPSWRPLVIALHGWHGCADSLYMLATCGALFDAGFDIARLQLRDHGGTEQLNRELFHSGRITEVVDAAAWLREHFPERPLGLLGFSLGANFALRVALQAPERRLGIAQVVATCPVMDPQATLSALDAGLPVYRWHFLRRWRQALAAKARAWPEMAHPDRVPRFKTIAAMTEHFVAQHTVYPDLEAYLASYTLAGETLEALTVPTRMLVALDDPVIPAAGVQRLARPTSLTIETTVRGGHCGFLGSGGPRGWLADYVCSAFAKLDE